MRLVASGYQEQEILILPSDAQEGQRTVTLERPDDALEFDAPDAASLEVEAASAETNPELDNAPKRPTRRPPSKPIRTRPIKKNPNKTPRPEEQVKKTKQIPLFGESSAPKEPRRTQIALDPKNAPKTPAKKKGESKKKKELPSGFLPL